MDGAHQVRVEALCRRPNTNGRIGRKSISVEALGYAAEISGVMPWSS
jgi:hypothetical protein